MIRHTVSALVAVALCSAAICTVAYAQQPGARKPAVFPWNNATLSPDERANLVIQRMTFAEKIRMVHGAGFPGFTPTEPSIVRSNGGAGFVPGIRRLGIPDLNMSDSAMGVANTAGEGRYATALPSALALASSWDEELACQYGSLIGAELVDEGFNVSLGGGVNLARDPRDGRIFEFLGEDPILAGNMAAHLIEGVQSHHVIGDVKHFAVNDQETGRMIANAVIGVRALRETDLLAFQIAVQQARPGMVMCAYNLVNGVYSCQNGYLLDRVLKKDWGFKGWVISDWGATHSTVRAALAGLDMQMPDGGFFGSRLALAVRDGRVPMARLNDMVHRILRTEFASGVVDHPQARAVPNIFRGFAVAQKVEEESAVLLKNSGLLPLQAHWIASIAVIGSHADVGVLSGGGSSQVDPPGGNAVHYEKPPGGLLAQFRVPMWDPSSPLKAIRAHVPAARVIYDPGTDPAKAADVARSSQIAVVFVHQHMLEGYDVPSLALPGDQNQLVEAVAAANPRTIVVLETGGPVEMPWLASVKGVLEAWYPGIRGGQAIADLLFGTVNPSGKLAATFPRSAAQLPRPVMPQPPRSERHISFFFGKPPPSFNVRYTEGLKVGYKWFDAQHETPLFPFGYGLSYSTFVYSDLSVRRLGGQLQVRFKVSNTSGRAGTEVGEVYVSFPKGSGEPPKRLVGWARVHLKAGETRAIALSIRRLYLSVFDAHLNRWHLLRGRYEVRAGPSSRNLPLSVLVRLH